jgi:hypothetical protein
VWRTFFADIAYAGIVDALLVELGVMLERVAGFADAVEIVGTTFSIALWFLGHASLGYLVIVSGCIFTSCRWVRTPHMGICASGRFRLVDGDARDVSVLVDVVACDDVELAMLDVCVSVVAATEVLDSVVVWVVAPSVVEVGAGDVANGAHSSGMSSRCISSCSHPFLYPLMNASRTDQHLTIFIRTERCHLPLLASGSVHSWKTQKPEKYRLWSRNWLFAHMQRNLDSGSILSAQFSGFFSGPSPMFQPASSWHFWEICYSQSLYTVFMLSGLTGQFGMAITAEEAVLDGTGSAELGVSRRLSRAPGGGGLYPGGFCALDGIRIGGTVGPPGGGL